MQNAQSGPVAEALVDFDQLHSTLVRRRVYSVNGIHFRWWCGNG
jgi:hypothetical protein